MSNKIDIHNLKIETVYHINKRAIFNIVLLYITMIVGIILLFTSMFSFNIVISGSMKNTIQINDTTLTNKLSYTLNIKPQRYDIVDFISPDEREEYVKRIIGLPNDVIIIKDGKVFVNGEVIQEDYIIPLDKEDCGPFVVPEGQYFVLGDNRPDSNDSRYWKNKFVKKEDISGKVICSYNLKDFRLRIY